MQILQENNMLLQISETNDEHLNIIFRMNVANFQKGQPEPKDSITLTITDKFNVMDRLLDLDNFCSSKCK